MPFFDPESHDSTPTYTFPSPQAFSTHPPVQASVSSLFPSSHASVPSTVPFPQYWAALTQEVHVFQVHSAALLVAQVRVRVSA
jgi:hypothetical protein